MGFRSCVAGFSILLRFAVLVTLGTATGCQMPQPGLGNRFVAHLANVDASGLTPATKLAELNVEAELPHGWEAMDTQSTAIYTHQQWRAANHATGVGVAYIHMPLPMSAKALVWLAKSRYSQQNARDHKPDPQMQGEWTDSLGREWFEGENDKYHVKGYVLTSGFDAWVVYAGYRLRGAQKASDISLAIRAMDSVMPLPLKKQTANATGIKASGAAY